ncbi:AAA family ATPase [Rhizobium ruizarguesonis]
MDHRRIANRSATLEHIVYGIAIKKAARLAGLFRKHETGRQIVVVLRLPPGADLKEYDAAASILVVATPELAKAALVAPKIDRKGAVDVDPIYAELRSQFMLVVVWPAEHDLPAEVALAADRVVDVEPPRPFHLVAAAKSLHGQILDLKDAEQMLEHPVANVFAAFRPGRSPADVLRRLDETSTNRRNEHAGPRLNDIVGYGDAKAWATSLAADLHAWRNGSLSWEDVDRGLLLSGPPGTGKTVFASALARSCEAQLIATSVAKWQSAGHLGDTLAAMRRSFEEAVSKKPCILFIDEFDSIGDRAKFGGEHRIYWSQVVNLLLELIDGTERLEGVVIVGATNHPDRIDPALVRAGRLDRHIVIAEPDTAERRELARAYFGDDLTGHDLDRIAAATTGFTGADFAKAGREARRATRRRGTAIAIGDVLDALPKPIRIVGDGRRVVAFHEAGHAVVGVHLGVGVLRTVAVPWEIRSAQPAGFAHFELADEFVLSRETLRARIAMTLGGRAAEEELLESAYDGAGAGEGADLHKASDLATIYEIQFGMGGSLSYFNQQSLEQRDRIRQNNFAVANRVERILQREMDRSREIIGRFREAVEKIADLLVEKAVVDGDEVVRILQEVSA